MVLQIDATTLSLWFLVLILAFKWSKHNCAYYVITPSYASEFGLVYMPGDFGEQSLGISTVCLGVTFQTTVCPPVRGDNP